MCIIWFHYYVTYIFTSFFPAVSNANIKRVQRKSKGIYKLKKYCGDLQTSCCLILTFIFIIRVPETKFSGKAGITKIESNNLKFCLRPESNNSISAFFLIYSTKICNLLAFKEILLKITFPFWENVLYFTPALRFSFKNKNHSGKTRKTAVQYTGSGGIKFYMGACC